MVLLAIHGQVRKFMSSVDKVKYWIDLANEDIGVAKLLFKKKKLLFSGFLCHLTIERGLKALIAGTNTIPPKTHDLVKLAELSGVYKKMSDEQKDFLEILLPLNIEGRYPSNKDGLSASLDKATSKQILKETEIMLKWIETQL